MPLLCRAFLVALGCTAILSGSLRSGLAQEVTLDVHHFLSARAPAHAAFIEPWARRIEEKSDGRIKIDIYPGMSLGGRPQELYNQAVEGKVDIIWTVAGYTPGRFPRVEVFELPFIHTNDAVATNLAIQDLYDQYLADDFVDVHPLLIHVHAGQAFNMTGKAVRTLDDLKGRRIRIPSRTGGWMLQALGAESVGMPVPALPLAFDKDIVDGALIPLEVVLPLKVHERTSSSTVGHDDIRFGNTVFIFAMNKAIYEGLPSDLRAIIDDNSGINLAAGIGDIWMEAETKARQVIEAKGNEIIELHETETERFRQATEAVVDRWIDEVADVGIDGKALAETAKGAIAAHQAR